MVQVRNIMHYINRKDNDMTSAIKDQLTLDNSNEESKMVVSNTELREKILFWLEVSWDALAYPDKKWANYSEAMKEIKELVNQIN